MYGGRATSEAFQEKGHELKRPIFLHNCLEHVFGYPTTHVLAEACTTETVSNSTLLIHSVYDWHVTVADNRPMYALGVLSTRTIVEQLLRSVTSAARRNGSRSTGATERRSLGERSTSVRSAESQCTRTPSGRSREGYEDAYLCMKTNLETSRDNADSLKEH
jgi:hypothetical protein